MFVSQSLAISRETLVVPHLPYRPGTPQERWDRCAPIGAALMHGGKGRQRIRGVPRIKTVIEALPRHPEQSFCTLEGNSLRASARQPPELGDRLSAQPGLSFRDTFGTQVGHKDRKRLTRADKECGTKQCLTW